MTTYPATPDPDSLSLAITVDIDQPLPDDGPDREQLGRRIADMLGAPAGFLGHTDDDPTVLGWTIPYRHHGAADPRPVHVLLAALEENTRHVLTVDAGLTDQAIRVSALGARTGQEIARRLTRNYPATVGIAGACRLLDVSRQRLHELRQRTDFPPSYGDATWLLDDMQRYAVERNRQAGRPPTADQEIGHARRRAIADLAGGDVPTLVVATFMHVGIMWAVRAGAFDGAYTLRRDDDQDGEPITSWVEPGDTRPERIVSRARGELDALDRDVLQQYVAASTQPRRPAGVVACSCDEGAHPLGTRGCPNRPGQETNR